MVHVEAREPAIEAEIQLVVERQAELALQCGAVLIELQVHPTEMAIDGDDTGLGEGPVHLGGGRGHHGQRQHGDEQDVLHVRLPSVIPMLRTFILERGKLCAGCPLPPPEVKRGRAGGGLHSRARA